MRNCEMRVDRRPLTHATARLPCMCNRAPKEQVSGEKCPSFCDQPFRSLTITAFDSRLGASSFYCQTSQEMMIRLVVSTNPGTIRIQTSCQMTSDVSRCRNSKGFLASVRFRSHDCPEAERAPAVRFAVADGLVLAASPSGPQSTEIIIQI